MKRSVLVTILVVLTIGVAWGINYTRITHAAILNSLISGTAITSSTVDSSAIGGITPAAAVFTTARATSSFTGSLIGNADTATNANNANNAIAAAGLSGAMTPCTNGRTPTGINADGSANCNGFQVKYGNNGNPCLTTAGSQYACDNTITWVGGAFADSAYYPICSGIDVSQSADGGNAGQAVTLNLRSKSAANVVVVTESQRGAPAAQFNEIDCIGIHP